MTGSAHVDFAAVFDVTPTPSLVLDPDLVIVAANDAALRAADCTRADLLGRSILDDFPDNPADPVAMGSTQLKASLDRVVATALPDTMAPLVYDVPAADGGFLRRVWTPVNIPLLDAAGQVQGVLHRSEEITSYVDRQDRADASTAGSALHSAHADLRRTEGDLYARGLELGQALASARRWAEQQAALVDIARSLGDAQDEDAVLDTIARCSVSLLGASGSALCLREPDGTHVRILITDTIDADVRSAIQVVPLDFPLPLVHTAATGQAHFHDDRAATVGRFPGAEALYTAADTQASANAPLRGHVGLLGSLSMAFTGTRAWAEQERDLVGAFAALVAQALERLTARDGERAASATAARFSETLQRSMLTDPPQPDHLQLVVRYSPAAAESQVGGDWYDAYLTPGGSTSLIIGDVAGHDQNAAAVMGQMRNLLRGIGHAIGDPPAAVLRALDHAAHDLGVDGLASIVLAQVEQPAEHLAAGTRLLRWSNAGHPPPLLLEPGAPPRFLDAETDLLVGIDPDTTRTDHEVVLAPGAAVLFYTDGLVERRDASLDDGLQWLARAAGDLDHGTLDELCDGLLALVGGQVEDDVALLALRAHPEDAPRPPDAGENLDPRSEPTLPSAGPDEGAAPVAVTVVDVRDGDGPDRVQGQDGARSTVLLLDPDPASVREARTFVHDYCCRQTGCGDTCDTLTLLVSEVVTNAIVHGRSQARLQVSVTSRAVRVEVSDDDSRLPVLAAAGPDALGGRGLAMVDLLASAWGVRDDAVGKTVWLEVQTG